jgi:transketolase
LFDEFRAICPGQYMNAGVAEQNMVGVAAGLAKSGFRPVVYGLSAFIPVRVLEQIKLDICYERLPVVLVGDGAGVVYSHLGSSHQSTEDLAALRAVPHMALLSPADAHEMTACLDLALQSDGPVYLRMGKADLGLVHARAPALTLGGLCPIQEGPGPLAWIATGSMVQTALTVAGRWAGSAVWSAPCIKPLRMDEVKAICEKYGAIIVLEEHSIHGGLGSALAEIAAGHAPSWLCSIGVPDRFSRSCGSYQYLMREHQLDADAVGRQVESFLARLRGKPRPAVAA